MSACLIAGQPMLRMDIRTKEERKPPASQLPGSSEREIRGTLQNCEQVRRLSRWKGLVANPDDLSSGFGAHPVEGEN